MPDSAPPVPRGRHAPPLEVRLARQRARLFAAAAAVFARVGYAEASAEAISREAGMSKATFYEHFANKEECILALFDAAAAGVRDAVATATQTAELARRAGDCNRAVTEALDQSDITAALAVEDVRISGTRATARVAAGADDKERMTLQLERVGRDWRIASFGTR